MNTPFWHIVWKEYRAVRGFWLGLAVLGMLWQWLLAAVLAPGLELSAYVYATPLVAAALFVTGCLAAVFAAEREEETLGFLQILPATSWVVARGKLALAGLSTLLLAAVLLVTAAVVAGWWSDRAALATIVAVFGVAVFECAAWAALFSLLWRRPLLVAIAAIAAASVATHVAIGFANPTPVPAWSLATYAGAWEARLALAVAVALAAGLVARRWMDGGSFGERVATWWRRTDTRRRSATETQEVAAAPPRPRAFPIVGRLLWQTWRQSWRVALVFVLLGPPIVGFLTYSASLASDTPSTPWWIGLSAVLGGLVGSLTFQADQESCRYRFFAERAERPGLVWFVRLLFWGTALVLMTLAIHLAAGYRLVEDPARDAMQGVQAYLRHKGDDPAGASRSLEWAIVQLLESWLLLLTVGFSVLVHLAGFCIGQLCSMAVRSGVIAGFVASIATVVFVAWAAVLVAWELQGPLAWTLVVIPLSLLLATRLLARGWLLDRHGWRTWLWPAGVVAVPAVLIAASIPSSRTHLPVLFYLGGDLAKRQDMFQQAQASYQNALAAAAEKASETADLYLRACDLLEPSSSLNINAGSPDISVEVANDTQEDQQVREWIESNAAALELALDAAARDVCIIPPEIVENDRRIGQLRKLILLVNASGGALARAGPLDEALERHLAALAMTEHFLQFQRTPMRLKFGRIPTYNWITEWARADGQTPERLKQAIDAIEGRPVVAPPLGESLLADYFHLRSILLGEKDPSAGGLTLGNARTRLAYLAHQLPWERERALAALDRVYTEKLFGASAVDQSFARGVTSRVLHRYSPSSALAPDSALRTMYYLLALYNRLPESGFLSEQIAAEEFYRRALLVRLALAAYRLEHGEYPESLAELEDEYLAELPTDNLALEARTFYYHPEGLDAPLHDGSHRGLSDPPPPIPAGTPLFWSPREGHAPFGELGDSPRPRLLKGVNPPFYELPGGASVFVLPRENTADEDRPQGRPPEEDGVPVEQIDMEYGMGYGGGYDGGYGGGYGGGNLEIAPLPNNE